MKYGLLLLVLIRNPKTPIHIYIYIYIYVYIYVCIQVYFYSIIVITFFVGLHLNKCVAIPMNNEGSIATEYEATYLGNEINREVNVPHEISNKLREVRRTWIKSSPYWKVTQANNRWKLIVYDAMICSKLLYGLEMARNCPLNHCHGKEIRTILNKAHTHVDRTNTNAKPLEEASMIAFPSRDDQRKILLFTEFHNLRRAKLLGHILRSTSSDPLRHVSFMPSSAGRIRIDYGKQRVG